MPKNAFFVRSQHDPKLIFHQLSVSLGRILAFESKAFDSSQLDIIFFFEVARIVNSLSYFGGVLGINDRNL